MNDRSRNTHTPPAWPHFTISRTKKETFIEESVGVVYLFIPGVSGTDGVLGLVMAG